MNKRRHEIRDAIHTFIHLDSEERKVVDSRPFQRLRHIHQLALTNLVYPGATHRRFEHSLGVMELAGRVYDIVTDPPNLQHDSARSIVPEHGKFEHQYWRRVVRMAALCHDIGHLPFSHAGEGLLPDGKKHEYLTVSLVESSLMQPLWASLNIKPSDVAKLAVGAKGYHASLSEWEAILSEIIIGDAFGVDRIDYLLRDAYHTGVAYGKFDHNRLIDCLRILPKSEEGDGSELALGVEGGGLHAAEALLLARYFMYAQVYFHPVRRAYDHHLVSFLKTILPDGRFSLKIDDHLALTDNEVMCDLLAAARDPGHKGHVPARFIAQREHFKLLYERTPTDIARTREAGTILSRALAVQFGESSVYYWEKRETSRAFDFPVQTRAGVQSSSALSEVLRQLPVAAFDYIFVARDKFAAAQRWLKENREKLLDEALKASATTEADA